MAQLDYLLPAEYVRTMEATLREAPTSSEADVRAMFRSEFGVEADQVFAEFSPTPIASASLAQVHRARLRDGTEVAVKIQHVGLREACSVDVRTIEFLIRAVHRAFPRFNYLWLVEEMKLNLPRELNFRIEGQNMERCARIFRDNPDIVTPTVLWALSSARVLTMTFEEVRRRRRGSRCEGARRGGRGKAPLTTRRAATLTRGRRLSKWALSRRRCRASSARPSPA